MAAVVLCSHDGFGVGHVCRHAVLAQVLRQVAPTVQVTILTGLPFVPPRLAQPDIEVVPEAVRPDVVAVDRHPFGSPGELPLGIEVANALGARRVVGLRDILDNLSTGRAELASPRRNEAVRLFDAALVYGAPQFYDHATEYGMPLDLRYCGCVVEEAQSRPPIDNWFVVSAGGGGDGRDVLNHTVRVAERLRDWRVTIAAGGTST